MFSKFGDIGNHRLDVVRVLTLKIIRMFLKKLADKHTLGVREAVTFTIDTGNKCTCSP